MSDTFDYDAIMKMAGEIKEDEGEVLDSGTIGGNDNNNDDSSQSQSMPKSKKVKGSNAKPSNSAGGSTSAAPATIASVMPTIYKPVYLFDATSSPINYKEIFDMKLNIVTDLATKLGLFKDKTVSEKDIIGTIRVEVCKFKGTAKSITYDKKKGTIKIEGLEPQVFVQPAQTAQN
jgi:hypothetical protein